MYIAFKCPCCDSDSKTAYPAVVSPFVAAYALEEKPARTRLLECATCGFRFFEDRFTEAEAAKLYAGYRNERYYRVRHRHEPWYTRKAHEAVGASDPSVAEARRNEVERFLRAHVDVSELETILDFGGDRGQIIPRGIGKERSVYEISDAIPIPGVSKIGSAAELRGRAFDLVLLCHVLEHCSEPKTVIEELRPLLTATRGVLYVEVPFERASLRWLGKRQGYARYLDALRQVPPLLVALDLYSTLFRVKWDVLPPLGFVKMHEHINFFDEGSLSRLLRETGFDVVALEKMKIQGAFGQMVVLGAAARPSR